MSLRGMTAVITGAAQGIGRGIAERLASDGADLILLDVNDDGLADTRDAIKAFGRKCVTVHADVANRQQVADAIRRAMSEMDAINILVNDAGVYTSAPLAEVTEDDWNHTIAVNLTGVFFCCQLVAPYLVRAGGGRIVNIASNGAKIPWVRNHAYCASKAGVIALTKVLALELATQRITVNAVCPGNTLTAMMDEVDANICASEGLEPGTFKREKVHEIPLGRYAVPADIAGVVAFLVSEDGGYVTGQALNVDGGLVLC